VKLKNPDLPVINVGSHDKPAYLPAQVCTVIAGQPAKSNLNPKQTQKMIDFAVRQPVHNAKSIVTTSNQVLGFKPPNASMVCASLSHVSAMSDGIRDLAKPRNVHMTLPLLTVYTEMAALCALTVFRFRLVGIE